MTEKVRLAIPLLPHSPGVYIMKDDTGRVIYVGKAINLYNRVSQYFLKEQFGKVKAMVNHVDYFETILTKTDKEAFLLEENLIHTYYPRYNILLKDDKHYPYIALKKKGDPFLKIARNKKDKNYYYFGPYSTSSYAYEIIHLLNKIFPTRKCRNIPSSPCLYYHLGQCLAPCVNKVDEKTYLDLSNRIHSFLDGQSSEIKKEYLEKMLNASDKQEYEKANEYKEILKAIDHIQAKQTVERNDNVDRDVYGFTSHDGYLCLTILTYRNGILLGKDSYIVEEFGEQNEQITELILHYYQNHDLPDEILINIPSIKDEINKIYEDVDIKSASKGQLLDLIEMAMVNAKNALDSHFVSARLNDDTASLLDELGELLHIKTPYRIELFDNSHIQGDAPVGAVVVFINGEPVKKLYRKFNIEHIEKRDDFASMKEVISRRYNRLKENNEDMPDLILVDGGLTQIHAASEIINNLELDIPIFGLYKNDKHQTKGIMDKDGNTFEVTNKSLFFMLVRMQDEVHRFAIGFHHLKRSKQYNKSVLDDIKGLGAKRKNLILHRYQTIDALKEASLDELSQLVPEDVAKAIKEKLAS